MNKSKIFLYFTGLLLAAAIGLSGHWFLAFALWIALDSALAARGAFCYVNTLGTLATATIIQEALALVFAKRPILRNISMGFTDRNGSPIAQFNQAVITRTLGLPTVQDAGSNASATSDIDVSVTLNAYKQLRYDFTPQEYSGTNRDLVRERAEPMAVAMANHMVDAIAALWVPANYPARTGADAVANGATVTKTVKAAGWDYTHLVDVRATLNKAGVPQFGRFYVGNTDVYGSMLSDLRIVGYLNNQQNAAAIESGRLPNVAGMALDEYPNLSAIVANNTVAVAGTIDSTVYAHRVPRDPREVIPGLPVPGNIGVVTEPRTGLSVMVIEDVDMSTLNVRTRLMWMYGTAVGNPNNLQRITTV